MEKKEVVDFFKSKKVQWAIVGILFLIILITSVNIRTSNLDLLKDTTTGEYIPLALDPFYFLRMAETIVDQGGLPECDAMRFNPVECASWHPEILSKAVVVLYDVSNIFGDYSLRYIDVISPVIFFGMGLIVFFILIYILTKNKFLAFLASAFLAFNGGYLYRTMAGFSDHEAIGMVSFFIALTIYAISIIALDSKKNNLRKSLLAGGFLGLGTLLTYASWSGVTTFLFIIIPLSFFIVWLMKVQNSKNKLATSKNLLIFYVSWISFSILLAPLLNRTFSNMFNLFLGSTNILSLGILLFILIDFFLIFYNVKMFKKIDRTFLSLIGLVIIGSIGLFLVGKNPMEMGLRIIQYLIQPFAEGRFGATVAENAQPFLSDWMGQVGKGIFWLFFFGVISFGLKISRGVKKSGERYLFFGAFSLMVVGIIFSKYAPDSIFNGNNFISQATYIITLMIFWIYFFYLYSKKEINISGRDAIIFGVIFYTIIAGRAAARVFFAITPFVCFMSAYLIFELKDLYFRQKDNLFKILVLSLLILGLFVGGISLLNSYEGVSQQAQYTGPSANQQWQNAMSWTRENTPEGSVFSHWWDYGYWVQYLGERPTIADGGHFQGAEDGNHKIGRYLLTTPNPETAYSYIRSMEIDYLLIDQTDLGKYSAYSKIGSDDSWDRFSTLPLGILDNSQVTESEEFVNLVYNVQGIVDEDIRYTLDDGREIFLPGTSFTPNGQPLPKSYIIGILLSHNKESVKQPEGVFYYNGIQYRIPLRYVYINGEIVDFKTGLDSVAYIFPALKEQNGRISVDNLGAISYLSSKVQNSLFARVYLMNNVFGDYDHLKLIHSEDDRVVRSLKAQQFFEGDILFYNGFRGPIKIWETNYPKDTPVHEEFYEFIDFGERGFGSLDELF